MLHLTRFLFATGLSVGATYGCSKQEPPSAKMAIPAVTAVPDLAKPETWDRKDRPFAATSSTQVPAVANGTEPTVLPLLDRSVEPRRTITQGLYGQTTEQDDVGPPRPPRAFPMALSVFAQGKRKKPIAEVTSDGTGFYQIPLDVGAYDACTSFRRCVSFRVAEGNCVRLDYEFSVGPGWSRVKTERCETTTAVPKAGGSEPKAPDVDPIASSAPKSMPTPETAPSEMTDNAASPPPASSEHAEQLKRCEKKGLRCSRGNLCVQSPQLPECTSVPVVQPGALSDRRNWGRPVIVESPQFAMTRARRRGIVSKVVRVGLSVDAATTMPVVGIVISPADCADRPERVCSGPKIKYLLGTVHAAEKAEEGGPALTFEVLGFEME